MNEALANHFVRDTDVVVGGLRVLLRLARRRRLALEVALAHRLPAAHRPPWCTYYIVHR